MTKTGAENLTILLAEDDKGHAALVKRNLWRTCIDAQIIHFSNGQQLLAYLNGESVLPEPFLAGKYILLLDIKMPGMDGTEVLKILKQHPELRKIPVIMLTTTNNPHEIELCYQEGCSFYIVKPSDYVRFMEAIEYLGDFLSLPTLLIPDIVPSVPQAG
jgi:CheY-like chemotaxis protein